MSQVYHKILKGGSAAAALIAAMAILFCSRDYNPFSDLTNAKVHVLAWSFTGRDSVSIYETGTFKVVVALREEVDSFTFHAPKNRFWRDTTVRAPIDKIINGGPYWFNVSFFDTGRDTVTLTTFRSNGEILSQDFSVRVRNPLLQAKIRGYFGDTVLLSTPTVPDTVLYHWRLEQSWRTSSVSKLVKVSLPLINPTSGLGWLCVSDLAGNHASPEVPFSYSLIDVSKPIISCINDGLQDKTIISGDSVFAFKVRITDAGNTKVDTCSVNGTAFDFSKQSDNTYTKVFNNLPELTKNNVPLTLVVYAMDNTLFRNESRDTFSVMFKPGAVTASHVSVDFVFPPEDTLTVPTRTAQVYGNATSDHGDTLKVSVKVNGTQLFSSKTVYGKGDWGWFVPLENIITIVEVSACGPDNRLLASSQRVIIFDANVTDTVDPVIWEVLTDGTALGREFYTEKDAVPLRIIAFDRPSGMAKLIINQDTLSATDTTFIWDWTAAQLHHEIQGNPVHIVAVDKKGNSQERLIRIYKNSLPAFSPDIGVPDSCCMGLRYSWQLAWTDPEGDAVRPDIFKIPAGMHISLETGIVSWTPPLLADTARDTLIVDLWDAYGSNRRQWLFTSFPCNQSSASIVFKTQDSDFPAVLQAGIDRLNVRLSIDSAGLSFTPRYSARFLDKKNHLFENDSLGVLRWAPTNDDTGFRKLMVTVGNEVRVFDTLYAAFQVVPKNQFKCTVSARFTGIMIPTGGLDMFTHPAPETLFFTIYDQDHPLTESYSVTVSLGGLRSVATFNQKDFFIAIEPQTSKTADTLSVSVADRSGGKDSLRFFVQYAILTANRPPELTGAPTFPVYFCANTPYSDTIRSYDPNGDLVTVLVVHSPPDMKVAPQGTIEWSPPMTRLGKDSLVVRLFDQHDTAQPQSWQLMVLDCANKPNPVRFLTRAEDFPTWLQAEVDSVSLQLKTVPATGTHPFVFEVETDRKTLIFSDTVGKLLWKPVNSDTGTRTLRISIRDRYDTGDSLFPRITVVPRNCQPCSLSYTYSGTTLPSGFLYMPASEMYSSTPPESARFVINDADNPLTEQYEVRISQRAALPTILSLPGADRSFSVKIASNGYSGPLSRSKDTIVVSVKDKTGKPDTVTLIIQYPISAPSDISQLSLALSASSGISAQRWGSVERWSDNGPGYSNAVTQMDYDRQPSLDQYAVNGKPAVYFDHTTDNGDDGLFNTSFSQWAASPFTVMVVFAADSLPANNRQTLLSTNTPDGFGVGIACDGRLGVFNNSTANACLTNEWASTDLTVSKSTWYVATFESSLGITVGGNIRVQAWLNGTAASQPMEIARTQSGRGLAVGTGSTDYTGSFGGYIAAFAIYQRALSNDERSLVERYLGGQYKITIH